MFAGCKREGADVADPTPSAVDQSPSTTPAAEQGLDGTPRYPRKITSLDDALVSKGDLIEACTVALRGVLQHEWVTAIPAERRFVLVFYEAPPGGILEAFEGEAPPVASPFDYDASFVGGKFDGTRYVIDEEKRSVFIDIFEIEETGTDQLYMFLTVTHQRYTGLHVYCVVEKDDGRWQLHSLKYIRAL
jgi:hypothetical protein